MGWSTTSTVTHLLLSKIAGNRLSNIFTIIPTGMIIPKKKLIYGGPTFLRISSMKRSLARGLRRLQLGKAE